MLLIMEDVAAELGRELITAMKILHFHRAAVFLLLGLLLIGVAAYLAWIEFQTWQGAMADAGRAADHFLRDIRRGADPAVFEIPDVPTYLAAKVIGLAGLGMLLLSVTAAIVGRIRNRRERQQFAPIVLH